ncbi:PRC-barrel domain-containing protein [Palleronia sp.]|uniref:PRC-barrel domain-containing protein n=1 Tax=Palleronia sp. TaxID=1940284 RepID=UPI0035C7A90C
MTDTTTTRKTVALLVALMAPSALWAQDDAAASLADDAGAGSGGYELAENLKDRQVVNAVGQEIGELSNIIVRGDRITHAIISIGGFVGIGGSEVVVPFDVLTFGEGQITIQTIATADQIDGLTAFDPKEFGIAE